jgi:phosphoinositide-3-kinase regulatory subunit 4
VPNALAYQRAVETETNGYLVRQFLYNSLYDRLSTRPFLEDIEKKWLAFQLLCALRDCHAKGVYHGDIKTENILVTSWNWLYLADFSSSFKRVMLPEDNPGDFSYFFDTSGKRTCYLAPERFLPPGEEADPNAKVTWAMDVFSVGCVIAELFLETPIFSLSQLYSYRKGEYDPAISHLSKIPDKDLREMIAQMIQLDPEKRYSAEQYLDFWKGKVFPEYFYSFLHQYMELITDPSSAQYASGGSARNVSEADQRIERVWLDFDKISYFLGYRNDENRVEERQLSPRLGLGNFPVRLNIPNNEHYVSADKQPSADDGTLIFLTLVVSSLRNTAHAAARIKACDILLAFAERLTDEAKLDRVLPYLVTLLKDKCDMVVVSAVRAITQLLDLVKVITPVNSQIFLDYIMSRMEPILLDTQRTFSPIVRATYASCLGKLAITADRFLAMAATLRADGSAALADPEVEPGNEAEAAFAGLFDNARRELTEIFEVHTKTLIEDSDPFVRRAFLTSVPDLCIFFGAVQANDIILTHLNTYLNDRDWMLKCAFFDTIVGISAFLGSNTLEKFILPLMVQAITDPEEHVVQGALHSLAELANLGLLTKQTYLELVGIIGRFTMHPNLWIRESAAEFISAGTRFLSPAYLRVQVLPQLAHYLKPHRMPGFSELDLLEALLKPLSRSVFDQALLWASKADRGDFWRSFRKLRDAVAGPMSSRSDSNPQALAKSTRNDEDEQWLSKLRNLGLAQEDEPKLLALREFIWRLSQIKARDSAAQDNASTAVLNNIISLRSLDVRPQTVLFDEEPLPPRVVTPDQDANAPRTIKDALLDASMSIDDPVGKKRRAALNNHRSRLGSRDNVSPISTDSRRPLDDESVASSVTGRREGSRDTPRRTSVGHGKNATLSPMDDDGSVHDAPYATRRGLRHQSSAMNLMNRKESGKSGPEIGTTETNAFGEVEGPFRQAPMQVSSPADAEPAPAEIRVPMRANHTYLGNDPNILKMLDEMYVSNYPHDIYDYGPPVTPIRRQKSNKSSISQPDSDAWKPSGKLVATFSEHTGAINRVVVAPDHQFFLTGGDDGCVKVWDTARLERNITHRSRLTHKHAAGARVLALCFIENTHSFVSCASDGLVHVVKVETILSGINFRYPRLRLLREYKLPDGEFAVWCEHFKRETNSVLLLATNKSNIVGIDLRTMTLLYKLQNPVHHGTPTCFCVDRRRNWLLLGTSHGVLDLWDLRFKMRLKAWGMPGKGAAIYRLALHPTKGRGRWVCVAGGTGHGEVTVWDLERTVCREIYRVGSSSSSTTTTTAKESPSKNYEPWEVDEDKPEGMLGRFATSIEPASTSAAAGGTADRGVRAMVVGSAGADEQREVRHPYIVTAGADKKLRFWDLARIENSVVYSGLLPDEGRPTFSASQMAAAAAAGGAAVTVNVERWPRLVGGPLSGLGSGSSAGVAAGSGGAGGVNNGRGGCGRAARPAKSTVISLQQQQLLRSHLDAVVDVAVLESPYGMTVSVDRSGVVFVFQ